jgi:hypothetical protein
MKCLIAIILLCLALAGAVSGAEQATNNSSGCVGCNSDSANLTENQTDTHIFIQQGTGGSFVNDGSGNYTLTMTDVVPYTTFFADRPARDVGLVPMDKFLKGFPFGVDNPPNAAIILPDENGTSDMVVVELTKPQYNNTTQTVTYNAKLLKEYSFKSGWLQDHASEVDPAIPERFGNVELVIDGCPCQYVGPGAGCDATWWRNSCFRWKSPGKSLNGGCIFCVPCGGCCSCEGSCCPGQNCDKSKNPTKTKPPVKEEKVPVVPVKEKTNEVKYPYQTS